MWTDGWRGASGLSLRLFSSSLCLSLSPSLSADPRARTLSLHTPFPLSRAGGQGGRLTGSVLAGLSPAVRATEAGSRGRSQYVLGASQRSPSDSCLRPMMPRALTPAGQPASHRQSKEEAAPRSALGGAHREGRGGGRPCQRIFGICCES